MEKMYPWLKGRSGVSWMKWSLLISAWWFQWPSLCITTDVRDFNAQGTAGKGWMETVRPAVNLFIVVP